jgi:hypothetical protein
VSVRTRNIVCAARLPGILMEALTVQARSPSSCLMTTAGQIKEIPAASHGLPVTSRRWVFILRSDVASLPTMKGRIEGDKRMSEISTY